MSLFGPLLGLLTLLIIGLGFPLVILGERHFGVLWWPYTLTFGCLVILASLFIADDWLSALAGVLGATFVWGSIELSAQVIRVELGWFPRKEKKIRPPFADLIETWKPPHL
jgi:hypothetical protein